MNTGDRVKLIKGDPFGIEGVIESFELLTRPIKVTELPADLDKVKYEKNFACVADDGTEFFGFEDELELLA